MGWLDGMGWDGMMGQLLLLLLPPCAMYVALTDARRLLHRDATSGRVPRHTLARLMATPSIHMATDHAPSVCPSSQSIRVIAYHCLVPMLNCR
jgi:hypothetical protein